MAIFHSPRRQAGWVRSDATNRATFNAALRQHMLRVYNFMATGLLVTGVVAIFVSGIPIVASIVFDTPLKWLAMLAPLAFIFILSWRFDRLSLTGLQLLFWAFCCAMGLSVASIFLVFTGVSIARVFFIAAAMFAAVSLYGYTTKTDLSKMGSFLSMGLVGIILAALVNVFLVSSAVHFAISVIGVLVFTGLTAYDTQRIKEMYVEHYGDETNAKLALMGALSLYLNIINLIQMLMHFMGDRE